MPASEDVSLEELVDLFLKDPEFASGARPAPRAVDHPEVLRVLDDIFAGCNECDQVIPGIAEELGRQIACERGCPGRCCEVLILVTVPEGIAIASTLTQAHRADDRARYITRLREWKEQLGPRAEEGARAFAEGRQDDYDRVVHEHALEHVMCPLADGRMCGVYAERPLACRKVWAVDTWENCGGSSEPNRPKAELLTHPSIEELYSDAKRVCSGMQSALGMGTGLHPLPLIVLAFLEVEAAAPTPPPRPGPSAP